MNWRNLLVALLFMIVAFAVGHFFGYKRGHSARFVAQVDTCTIYVPTSAHKPREMAKLTVGEIAVPVVLAVGDTIVVHDTTYIYLSREQKYYSQENLYDCWVSGVAVQLDSLNVYQKEITIRIPPQPRPLNSLSLRASFGYAGRPCLPLLLNYGRELGPVTFRAGAGYDVLLRKPIVEVGAEVALRW